MGGYNVIVATDSNGTIGVDGEIPWDLPEDRHYFRDTTMGALVVMGRKTYDSLPNHSLPGRTIVVISRLMDSHLPEHGLFVVGSKEEALVLMHLWCGPVFVVGGGEIYRLFDRPIQIHLTTVKYWKVVPPEGSTTVTYDYDPKAYKVSKVVEDNDSYSIKILSCIDPKEPEKDAIEILTEQYRNAAEWGRYATSQWGS